jgi:hypothetical protein
MRTFLVIPLLVVGCGSSNEPKNPSVNDCSQLAKPASDKVLSVIEANRACSVDADCMTIALNSACFDQCSASIASSGRDAVDQALAGVGPNECKDFTAAGCKVIAPPCEPPMPPKCTAGKCG